MTTPPELSYEQARDQLVEVVRQLESGSVPLSQSMELWEAISARSTGASPADTGGR